MTTWCTGNAVEDGGHHRGWFVGHFLPAAAGIRASDDLEVKWGQHRAGTYRAESTWDSRTTLTVLVSGHFLVRLGHNTTNNTVRLTRPGDYAAWGPNIRHTWSAVTDSVVITVRWPSH